MDSDKPTTEFLTHDEASGAPVTATISAGALGLALRQMLGVARASPHWPPEHREGALAAAEYLRDHFELKVDLS